MRNDFIVLGETIKRKCGQDPVYYFPNPGNWGDGLIRHGTLKFLNDINLNFKEMTNRKGDWLFPLLKGGTVIYGGGGAWCKMWKHSVNIVSRLKRRFKVIVLPSTYELSYSIPNTLFCCRDLFESKQNMPNAVFCHDMAFYIGKLFRKTGKGNGNGYFFRCDNESANRINIPSCNYDISLNGNQLSEISPVLDEINKFQQFSPIGCMFR